VRLRLDAVGQRLDTQEKALNNLVEKVETVAREHNTSLAELEMRLTTRVNELNTSLSTSIKELEIKLTTKVNVLNTSLTANITNSNTSLTTSISDLDSSLTKKIGDVDKRLSPEITRIAGEISDVSSIKRSVRNLFALFAKLENVYGQIALEDAGKLNKPMKLRANKDMLAALRKLVP